MDTNIAASVKCAPEEKIIGNAETEFCMEVAELTKSATEISAVGEIKQDSEDLTDTTSSLPCYSFENYYCITKSGDVFKSDHCLRGCKWSPDGTCLLTNCEDKTLRLFDLPKELYEKSWWSDKATLCDVTPSLQVTESGLVYDFDWYPFMSSWDQATACFICSSTDCPVHLYDAFNGQIRASYRGYDQYDEVAHAYCVSFSSSGSSIFCGYNNNIKIFDVTKPGRDCNNINTKHVGKQKGIISCIADNPDMDKVFAAGSYRRVIGVYTVDGSSLCQLLGHKGGLTQIKFSPSGVRLYSASRKDKEILCWDLRKPGKTLFTLTRPHDTNQRIYFDLSHDDKYLISGSTDGVVRVWNIFNAFGNDNEPEFQFTPHKDCTNGVSFHRQMPLLATSSGQRHVPDVNSDEESDIIFTKQHINQSIKLWYIGPSSA